MLSIIATGDGRCGAVLRAVGAAVEDGAEAAGLREVADHFPGVEAARVAVARAGVGNSHEFFLQTSSHRL